MAYSPAPTEKPSFSLDEKQALLEKVGPQLGIDDLKDAKAKKELYQKIGTAKNLDQIAAQMAEDDIKNMDPAKLQKHLFDQKKKEYIAQLTELRSQSLDVAKTLEQKGFFGNVWEKMKEGSSWIWEKTKAVLGNKWVQRALILAVVGAGIYFGGSWILTYLAGQNKAIAEAAKNFAKGVGEAGKALGGPPKIESVGSGALGGAGAAASPGGDLIPDGTPLPW
jgi:hypothetical protein